MTTERTKSNFVAKIDKVETDFHKATGGRWISILSNFSPLGTIAEIYANTIAYKIETKRLEVELVRIKEQAELAHHAIEKNFELKMEELHNRRIVLNNFYATFNSDLQQLHIERLNVLKMAQLAQQQAFEPGLTLEERQLYKEMSIELVKTLPVLGEKSSKSLQMLLQTIPTVEISPKLLEG